MSELNRKLFYHLNDLREQYGLSIDEFFEGIVDRRQKHRYESGETIPKLSTITKLYEKLGLSQIEFYHSYYNSEHSDYAIVNRIYRLMLDSKYDEAHNLIIKFDNYEFDTVHTRKFFEFCQIYYLHMKKKEQKTFLLDKYKKLVNYPECLKKDFYTFIDVVVLRSIALIEANFDSSDALDKLIEVLHNNKVYLTSDNRHMIPSVYSTAARLKGMKKEFSSSLKIALEGIEFCQANSTMLLLENLYYICMLSYKELGDIENTFKYARLCLQTTEIKGDLSKEKHFSKTIAKDLSLSENDIIELTKKNKGR